MTAIERTVFFKAGSLELEGRLGEAAGSRAVVIAHPHPLYGGDLDNPVVAALAAAYQGRGYSTLRFNFRGVGASEGHHGDGRGEREDLRAAAAYLAGIGRPATELAGYSFGAWVVLCLDPPLATVRRQLLVAPPVNLLDFSAVPEPRARLQVIGGERDEFARPARLRECVPRWQQAAQLHVFPAADHFFSGGLSRLTALVESVLDSPAES
ncbi:MAG: alpha/beta hydrolase [Candidatus Competibacteraceae bacterium]|nr:alpha/beta hydrolase [Candidatus Competibacteraceae bacterium]